MDLASSSSSSSSSLTYDVFLSFRGQDTRESFVCHLHNALKRKTLEVYIDKEDLKKGDHLSDLLTAIAESKLSIVVFSENYANSTWCLKELVQILECKAKQDQIVMPIFYKVDPSHIRKQTGSFGEAIAKHELDSKKDKKEVQSWRSALKDGTDLAGWDSKNYEDDAELIERIVNDVFHKVNRISPHSHTEDGLVGMDSHLHEMRRLLNAAPDDVVYVGIWGMGGLGKTTIARAIYDRNSHEFDHCCFLDDVRENFMKKGKVQMQLEFLSRILNAKVDNLDAGYMIMLNRLGKKKILVVLDDVLDSSQIDTLLGQKPSFGGGSIIIVTTRDEHVVHGFEKYNPEPLSYRDALKLFCQNAFDTDKPSGEYEDLSRCMEKYAHGLPLALKVLGALLRGRSVSEWEAQIKKLKKYPDPNIEKVLKISYDGLDQQQQNIFLDISCFLKGMDKDCVTTVLDNCGAASTESDLNVLVERAFVTISDSNKLEMHDLLQEMGRKIESTKEHGKRSRFWGEDAEHVLTENTATDYAEGLMIDLPHKEHRSFNAEAFVRMSKLKLLIFTYGQWYAGYGGENHLIGDLKFLSRELRVLVWQGFPQKCLPSNFDPKNLVQLDMSYSKIEQQLWEGSKPAENLISINLRSSRYLKRIPDLTLATNLKELNFQSCSSLREVHPSISALKNLVFLNLSYCGKLRSLPSSIGHLKSLETLNLSHCDELRSLPSSIGHLKSLKTLELTSCRNLEMLPEISEDMGALSELDLTRSAIKELPWSIERLRGLKSLNMSSCESLDYLPDSICNLAELRSLCLPGCSKLHELPKNIGNLESLLELKVNGCGLERLPVSILRLKHGRLSFSECGKMEAPLSSWPSSIEDHCTAVLHLDFSFCNLMELSDALAHFSSLKVLRLSGNKNLESLPAIMKRLDFLVELKLNGCERLRSIPELSPTIRYINASDCTALESVSTPQSPYDIGRCFIFSNCSQLVQKDVFRDIVETHLPPQGNPSRPLYVSFPGSEIPQWFTHQCRGPSVTVKLPPNWFDKKFLGFTICAVADTNKPQGVGYFKLTARCFCTFKGDHCEYRFSFYLFDVHSDDRSKWFESNHMLVGYVPWSESGMIKREEVNERRYTEAKFEIQLQYDNYSKKKNRLDPCIERCGVRFVFANSDFGKPMAEVDNSERSFEGCSAEPSGTDITNEDEQYLKLSQVFKGANRPPSYIKIEDNDLSGKRKTLERWTQKVRVTSGLMQGPVDDGFKWSSIGGGIYGLVVYCDEHVQPLCWAKAIKPTHDDPTIFQITYVGRHTCWKFQPMLTHQVGVTPDMRINEGPFDGFTWGKYDQTDIPGAEYPRVYYYVCTPQNVKGCMAIKEVQHSSDKKILKITYRGRHTCIEASHSIAGKFEKDKSKGSVESSFHELGVLSPSSLGANSQDMSNRKEVTAKKSKGEEVAELEVEKTEKKQKDKDNGVLDSSDGEKSVKVKRHKGKEEAGSPFGYGSQVIVTTRDEQVLGGFSRIYKPKPLISDPDALELFNQNAFRTMPPSEEYDDLPRRAIKYAHGLPLALKIWGAYLRDRSPSEWKHELEMLKEIPDLDVHHVHHVLKRSFDGLFEDQQNIFLDIACFFKGMHKEHVEIILNSCGFSASSGLSVLIERNLVSISKCGGLEIHDLLQEIGRDIVRKEQPWKHSRLWSYEDVEDTIAQNKAMVVEGVMIELSGSEDMRVDPEAFVSMTNLRLLRITYPSYKSENFEKNFEGELWPERRYDYQTYSRCKLRLNGYNLKFLSHKLRVLALHGFPLKSLPSKFNPTYLVDLDMSHSHIEQLWPEPKAAKELISINLTACKNLKEIPLCTKALKLQELILDHCTSLEEVSPSISALTGLVFLRLDRCTRLRSLPSNIHMMKSLKTLVLSRCSNLEMFPEISEDMEALSELMLDFSAIKGLPSSIERLRGLHSLSMQYCESLVCLPDSICNLADLTYLYLEGCSKLCNLPENLGNLKSLFELGVQGTGLKRLPASILHLKIGGLFFLRCKQMEAPLSSWPSSIEDRCTVVVHLDFSYCNLMELSDAIAYFRSLKVLNLSRNKNLTSLPAVMNQLGCLERLELENCKSLRSIPELSSRISYINAQNCIALEAVSTPQSPYDIGRCFIFSNCHKLVQKDFFRDIVETHSPPQGNCSRPFYFSIPGSEIPEQFNHQRRGSSVTVQLPQNWFDNKFLGFTICAVTNKPQGVDYWNLTARCFCTFKGDHCEYRFSFCLCHGLNLALVEERKYLNHMLVGYVPWSEFGINGGEEVDERSYTEAKFEIELQYDDCNMMNRFLEYNLKMRYGTNTKKGKVLIDRWYIERCDPCIERCDPCIERCGVRFFFANNEDEEVAHQDFGEPMVQVDNSEIRSLEGCSAERSGSDITSDTSDEEEQYRKLSEVFEGALFSRSDITSDTSNGEEQYRKLLEVFVATNRFEATNRARRYIRFKDNDSSDPRFKGNESFWKGKTLESWTQEVRVTSGLMQGKLDDGFNWSRGSEQRIPYQGTTDLRCAYECTHKRLSGCWAEAKVRTFIHDRTILEITYIGRHTCWKTLPMLTHQVRVTPGMGIEGPFDGFTWGEYTQTNIPGAEYPRVYYYVCTPQNVKGCMAIKEVQHSSDQKILKITYRGRHTCIEASDSSAKWDDMEDKDMASCLCPLWWCWRLWTSITSRKGPEKETMGLCHSDDDQPNK